MPHREFPIVIRSSGEKLVPKFPIELKEGDQLLVARELKGSQVPAGEVWLVNGYGETGPIITKL